MALIAVEVNLLLFMLSEHNAVKLCCLRELEDQEMITTDCLIKPVKAHSRRTPFKPFSLYDIVVDNYYWLISPLQEARFRSDLYGFVLAWCSISAMGRGVRTDKQAKGHFPNPFIIYAVCFLSQLVSGLSVSRDPTLSSHAIIFRYSSRKGRRKG